MGFLVWGLFLIALGASFIFNALFGWNIPVFKVALGLLFLYWGFQILFDSPQCTIKKTIAGVSTSTTYKGYSTIFGKSTIDISRIAIPSDTLHIESRTVCGSTEIIIDPSIPTEINVSNTFATINLPLSHLTMVNKHRYATNASMQPPILILNIYAAFGTVEVKTF